MLKADEADFDGAAEELRGLVAKKPARARYLLELASLERARGRFVDAEAALVRAREEGTPEELADIGMSVLDQLASDLARERVSGHRVNYTLREVRGILRGSKDQAKRIAALNRMASAPSAEVVRQEITAYLRDPDPEVRKHTLRLLAVRKLVEAPEIKLALADSEPSVRAAAAPLAVLLKEREAVELLLAVMQKEDDPAAFRALQARRGDRSVVRAALPVKREAGLRRP
jgi:hypothetical protein